ncbi:MAG: MMPL family transporter [Burkholderiaceae bacterium]
MRRLAVAAWLVALAVGALLVARAHYSADLSAFLPADPDPQQRVLVEQLRSGAAARTIMLAIEGGDAPARADASRALAKALRASGRFELVQNGERGDWGATAQALLAHRYQLSPDVAPARFEPAGLRDAIGDTLSLLGTPAGAIAQPLLERDPTGETERIVEAITPAAAPRMDHGVWVSRVAPRALLLVATRAEGADLDAQAAAVGEIRRAFAPLEAKGLWLAASGTPVFAIDSRARIERQAALLGGLGLAAVGGLLAAAFSSLRALALAMLPVATGVVAGIAATALAFPAVHGLTLAFGSTMIGESVDYAIYYLVQAHDGGWRRWRARDWPTVRTGLLTSVCGFAVLTGSGFPGLAQLGVFSVAGLVAAAAVTRWVLPALAPQGAPGRALERRLGERVRRLPALLARGRVALAVLGVASLALVVAQGGRLWRADLASLSPIPKSAQDFDAALRADLGGADARYVVVAGGADAQAALRGAEAAGAALDRLVDAGTLAGYDTPARLLPSRATQAARQAALPDAATLRASLAAATRGGPLAAARLEPFVADVQAARTAPPVTASTFAGTPLAAAVDALLMRRPDGAWSALLPLQAAPGHDLDAPRVRAALAALPPDAGVQLLDIKQSLDALYARYLRGAITQSLLGVAGVVLLVGWRLRSPRRLATVLAPLALAVVLTLGLMAACGAALGILHLVGLLLVVAIGSNYGLFLDQLAHADDASADTVASLLLANATAVLGFGLLACSDIPALSAIGRVVAPGALLALACCAAFAPARRARSRS